MQNPFCIIGAKPSFNQVQLNQKLPEVHIWEVHLDLGHLSKVSRQHAAIAYNYEDKAFDLLCLSEDHTIKVTSFVKQTFRDISCRDEPYRLQTRDKIQISNEEFFFCLPQEEKKGSKKVTQPLATTTSKRLVE